MVDYPSPTRRRRSARSPAIDRDAARVAASEAEPSADRKADRDAARRADAAHFGRFGEAAAARWYRRAGYRVLATNWHCREGELDLVVSRDGAVTFVEVKARSSARFGTGAEAVDHRKQRRVRTAAIRWLDHSGCFVGDIRFDVVEVNRRGQVQVHQDCFG